MERTLLNRLSHHLQLCKDHLRDPAIRFGSPETVKSVKAIAKFADCPSLNHDVVSPACVPCGLLQMGNKWLNFTYSSHVVRMFVQLLLSVAESEIVGLAKMGILWRKGGTWIMLAHVGAALLMGKWTEINIVFYLINHIHLGCPPHAITSERLKHFFF